MNQRPRGGVPPYRGGGIPPYRRRRHSPAQRAVYRRRQLVVVTTLVLVVALIVVFTGGGGSGKRHHPQANTAKAPAATAKKAPASTPAVEAGLMPWKLPAPLSRMVALPGSGGTITVAGGLNPNQSSSATVYSIDPATGTVSTAGALADPVHDGAGAVIGGKDFVFGGGSPTTVATVLDFPGTGTGAVSGQLPAPRSDDSAITVGATTYILGGYTGSAPDAAVLATTDGVHFSTVTTLPVPVRYAAVAQAGGQIYVFGGLTVGGSGAATNDIQRIDPATRSARVVGHLPAPLSAAVAVDLGGHIYLAGGEGPTSAQAAVAGQGTTQLDGWATAASGSPTPGQSATGAVWAFDPAHDNVARAGQLQVPVSNAAVAVADGKAWLIGGESNGALLGTVQVLSPNPSFGVAGKAGAGSPYYGDQLLVADRGNNRLLLMDPSMQINWKYPNSSTPPNQLGFYFPDDAFFIHHGTAIISNQENNDTIVEIGYPSGKLLWEYGHPKVPGSLPGYLFQPDDAYLERSGTVTVADASNNRILFINPATNAVVGQIGNGTDAHVPGVSIAYPNGDTPLANGDVLVSEIHGSWIDEYTPSGKMVWSVQMKSVNYPSDPQQLGPDRYLMTDYDPPAEGRILEFNRAGKILWRYDATSGDGRLDRPSLAERLPNGLIMVNDDYNDRVVAIDPRTNSIVWQYGLTHTPGTAPGMLSIPDGFDNLLPNGTTPTHPQTG